VSGLTVAQFQALQAVVRAVPQRLGLFRNTLGHEPKNAPGRGLTCSVFLHEIAPTTSGLASTSLKVTFNVRLQMPMLDDPEDDIDPTLGSAAVSVMAGYAGGFSLTDVDTVGIDVRSVDIRGMAGTPMVAPFGYLDHDGKKYRAVLITVPLIINHVLTESA
jgi:hypothetical protein